MQPGQTMTVQLEQQCQAKLVMAFYRKLKETL